MNEKFYEKYSTDEQEVFVLIQQTLGASPFENQWEMLATTLGMVFCTNGKIDTKRGRLNWLITEEERSSQNTWNRFKKGQICHMKVRKLLDKYVPKNVVPEEFNAWCVVDVLEQKAACPQLEEVWAAYNKPVFMEDEILGTLTLNRDFDMFEGSFHWKESEISLILEVDAEDHSTWETACNTARSFVSELEKWDQDMRVFSAKELTSLANEWMEEDDESASPITEKIFAERISLSELAFPFEDEFTAYYEDDDMFWGHVIEVCGSLEQGIKHANIVG